MADPTREDIDATAGLVALEFGTGWCGFCQAARPLIDAALADSGARHISVEDGKGRKLGRTFGVKLWPTVVVLRDGKEIARVVRPKSEAEVRTALATT